MNPVWWVEQVLIIFSNSSTLTKLIIMMSMALVTKGTIGNLCKKAKVRLYKLLISL